MTLTKAQKAARKAARTRAARQELEATYGYDTYLVADGGFTGHSPRMAAIKANINRPGRLRDLVKRCNFKNGYLNQS